MSLKAFHLVFITCATLLAFGFGVWSFYVYLTQGGPGFLAMGLLSAAAGVLLVGYGAYFLNKFRRFGLL